MKVARAKIDEEFEDDGLFSVTFWMDHGQVPSYVSIARDEMEDPDSVYFEAEDQIHGFKTKGLSYSITGNEVTLDLSGDPTRAFFWDNSKLIRLDISNNDLASVSESLKKIFLS